MKTVVLAAAVLPVLANGFAIRGFESSAKPSFQQQLSMTRPRGPNSPDDFHRSEDDVNRAFEDLKKDLNQPMTNEEVIAKSKEWVGRSFDFLADLNEQGAVGASGSVPQNQETLNKQKKWINKFIDLAAELNRDISSGRKEASSRGVRPESFLAGPLFQGDASWSPRFAIKQDETTFQVSLEVPGVERSDIDIQVKGDRETLIVSGKRQAFGGSNNDSAQWSTFSKRFLLDPTVDVDTIMAKLNNGILVVTAKKISPTKPDDDIKRIPVFSDN